MHLCNLFCNRYYNYYITLATNYLKNLFTLASLQPPPQLNPLPTRIIPTHSHHTLRRFVLSAFFLFILLSFFFVSFFVGFFVQNKMASFWYWKKKYSFQPLPFFPFSSLIPSRSYHHRVIESRPDRRLTSTFINRPPSERKREYKNWQWEIASRFKIVSFSPRFRYTRQSSIRVQQLAIIYREHLILFWHRHDTIPPPSALPPHSSCTKEKEKEKKRKEQQRQPADFFSFTCAFCSRSFRSSIVTRKYDFYEDSINFPKILRRDHSGSSPLSVLALSFSFYFAFLSFSQTFLTLYFTHATEHYLEVGERKILPLCTCVCIYMHVCVYVCVPHADRSKRIHGSRSRGKKRV